MSSPYYSHDAAPDDSAAQQPDIAFDGAAENVSDAAENVSDNVQDTLQSAKEKISDAAAPVAEKARDYAEEQKQGSADRIDDAAQAVHRAADEIGKQSPLAGRYMHSGAEQLQRVSRTLRENSLDEIYRMTNRLAHDRPLAFIGGSVAAGFLLARILRSSGSTGSYSSGGHLS